DALHDPPGVTDRFHTEELVRIAGCMWCYTPRTEAQVVEAPVVAKGSITFGSLNILAKFNAPVIETWSRILAELPDSTLILLTGLANAGNERVFRTFE